jgi:hypothetical protein
VPLAAMLALPVLWLAGLSMLVGVQAVYRLEQRERDSATAPALSLRMNGLPFLRLRASAGHRGAAARGAGGG